VYRGGIWYVLRSSDGVQTAAAWGATGYTIKLTR
jgi:hypothetical protein